MKMSITVKIPFERKFIETDKVAVRSRVVQTRSAKISHRGKEQIGG